MGLLVTFIFGLVCGVLLANHSILDSLERVWDWTLSQYSKGMATKNVANAHPDEVAKEADVIKKRVRTRKPKEQTKPFDDDLE